MKENHLLTPAEVARYCNVSSSAVKRWIKDGSLEAFQTPGGHYRIPRSSFANFLRRHQIPVAQSWIEHGTTRVLIVDDDARIHDMIKEFLEMQADSYSVETAADGYTALWKVGVFNPDIVILDLIMPDLDGFEVCRRLKTDLKTKEIYIIALTGYPEQENLRKIRESGADAVLTKPLRVEELKEEMKRLRGAA